MKKVLTFIVAIAICVVVSCSTADAQIPMDRKEVPIGMSVGIKSNHLWRGYEVSDAAAFTSDLYISTWDGSFKFGIWGGAAWNGSWKEFDYYASYSIAGFNVAVWDIWNFSPGALTGYGTDRIFDYHSRTTGRFIDVSLGYRLPGAFPLGIGVATVVFGRDRAADYVNGAMQENSVQRYSTYVTLDYPILRSSLIDIDIACSGAFALQNGKDASGNTLKSNFYGKTQGVVQVALTASRTFEIGDHKLPVSIMGMWNPQRNSGSMQLAVTLLQF